MNLPEARTSAGTRALEAIVGQPERTLVGLDFDGTLSPIVDDPEQAYADPAAVIALGRLATQVAKIAVITGRPTKQAVHLGRFADIAGLGTMSVLGQYGVERWNAVGDEYLVAPDPPEIDSVLAELPAMLASADLAGARIEHKGRAVGVHTRTLEDPNGAFSRLEQPIRELASRHGLTVEPGKNVWEIRAPGVDKGMVLRDLVAEVDAQQVIVAGDDLGDLPAFQVALALRDEGLHTLLVCSASNEEDALTEIADVIVDGPPGITAWLTALADEIEG